MPTIRPLPLAAGALLLLAVGIAVAVLLVASMAAAGDQRDRLLASGGAMQTNLLEQALIVERRASDPLTAFGDFEARGRAFDAALSDALAEAGRESRVQGSLRILAETAARWRTLATRALERPRSAAATERAARAALLERFADVNNALRAGLRQDRARADRRIRLTLLILAIVMGGFAAAAIAIAVGRRLREQATLAAEARRQLLEDRRHRSEQEEFTRALQGARTEREAQRMLKRQLERSLDGATATVLNRNNSDNRLEAVTALGADSPLVEIIADAEPDDCLAVRFGRRHEREAGENPMLTCELCGAVGSSVTCVPSLVGGEVIGSVLVETPEAISESESQRLGEAVMHAAPVLASMRNLRLAQTRAATDALTGLANRRAAEETLKRLVAQADRSVSQCAVAMFDLDHFKKVNDVYGHDKGDQLLAAVGDVVSSSIRASDFVARFGGEEFLVVLPETDLEGGLTLCEKLREAIASLRIAGLGQSPSASFGLAVFPADGGEPEGLLRAADRALYDAKGSGRNCVRSVNALTASDA